METTTVSLGHPVRLISLHAILLFGGSLQPAIPLFGGSLQTAIPLFGGSLQTALCATIAHALHRVDVCRVTQGAHIEGL
jgi:hypothetical protein